MAKKKKKNTKKQNTKKHTKQNTKKKSEKKKAAKQEIPKKHGKKNAKKATQKSTAKKGAQKKGAKKEAPQRRIGPAPAPLSTIIEKYCCNTKKVTISFLNAGCYFVEVIEDLAGTAVHPDLPTSAATPITLAAPAVLTIDVNHPISGGVEADSVLVCVWTVNKGPNRPTDCSTSGSCSSSGSQSAAFSRLRNPYVKKSILP